MRNQQRAQRKNLLSPRKSHLHLSVDGVSQHRLLSASIGRIVASTVDWRDDPSAQVGHGSMRFNFVQRD